MREYVDRTLRCRACGEAFAFPVRDQKFHDERGYLDPKYCPRCRELRRQQRDRSDAPR